ncbi:MAG: hypothetical protein LBG99_01995 [Propionibacteriaceae bacterium]|jgi:hypothetical protein|nr:hypothetical protein [Propionibacteriaceae bacterium]
MKDSSTFKTIMIGLGIGLVVLALIAGFWGAYRWASSLWVEDPPPPPATLCRAQLDSGSASITIDQSRYASLMAGIAAQRGLVPRAVSIAITTAFQESDIRNLDYGDRDSLGIFQQRPSQGWGTEEQIMDPYYSTGKFFDEMVKVSDWQNSDIGDVAQAVQRSGFPDAYDKHVDRARLLASSLSGQTPASWSCIVYNPAPANPELLVSSMTRAYGATVHAVVTPGTSSEDPYVTLTASNEEIAWSVAAFAQSWATETGVKEVTIGSYEWKASDKTLTGWVGRTDSSQSSTTVIVRF